jgi:hypothetical protein
MRVFDRRQMIAVRDLDLSGTVREVFESAMRMGIEALAAMGATDAEILAVETQYRERDLERLEAQGSTGDLHAGPEPLYRLARKVSGA